MMEPIRLIRDKSELKGSCYFELLPGKYKGRHWNEGSLFLEEEVFGYLEPTIQRYARRFSHIGFVAIKKKTWERIIADFERLAGKLVKARSIDEVEDEIGLIWIGSRKKFAATFRDNAAALASLLHDLSAWLREQLQTHDYISVLGI